MYDNILVNEIAPRTHNSGHYSIEGCSISQFEHQVKIISNQKPENSTLKSPSVMINLLGDLWDKSSPNFDDTNKGVFIHLYNKTTPKKGRKMGHITVVDKNLQSANNIAEEEYKKLS